MFTLSLPVVSSSNYRRGAVAKKLIESIKEEGMYGSALCVFVGLTVGNFIWQMFTKREWIVAVERSLLQAFAIGAYLLAMAIR